MDRALQRVRLCQWRVQEWPKGRAVTESCSLNGCVGGEYNPDGKKIGHWKEFCSGSACNEGDYNSAGKAVGKWQMNNGLGVFHEVDFGTGGN